MATLSALLLPDLSEGVILLLKTDSCSQRSFASASRGTVPALVLFSLAPLASALFFRCTPLFCPYNIIGRQ